MHNEKESMEMQLAKAELKLVDEALRLLINPALGFEAEFKIELNAGIPLQLQNKMLARLNEVINQEFKEEIDKALDSTGRRILLPMVNQNMFVHESIKLDSIVEKRKIYHQLLKEARNYVSTIHAVAISSVDSIFQQADLVSDEEYFGQDEVLGSEEIN